MRRGRGHLPAGPTSALQRTQVPVGGADAVPGLTLSPPPAWPRLGRVVVAASRPGPQHVVLAPCTVLGSGFVAAAAAPCAPRALRLSGDRLTVSFVRKHPSNSMATPRHVKHTKFQTLMTPPRPRFCRRLRLAAGTVRRGCKTVACQRPRDALTIRVPTKESSRFPRRLVNLSAGPVSFRDADFAFCLVGL